MSARSRFVDRRYRDIILRYAYKNGWDSRTLWTIFGIHRNAFYNYMYMQAAPSRKRIESLLECGGQVAEMGRELLEVRLDNYADTVYMRRYTDGKVVKVSI